MQLIDFIELIKPSYVSDWYHRILCEQLESGRDVLISTPPGAGKTELVSILLPTHALCHDPKLHVISLSNSDQLARMASSNILRNLQSPAVQERWPLQFDKQAETQFTITGNDGRPSVHGAGVSRQVTGARADLLIFDDLVKSQADAFSETIREKVWSNFSSCAETRLLPNGRIVGIGTRWHLDDPIGRLLRRAQQDKLARQFIYVSLAAWNSGEDSFVLDTRTGEKKFFKKYRSLASKTGQPYSFSRKQLEGKKADLGPSRFSALYMQSPLTAEDQLFPPECWKIVEGVNSEELNMIVSAWDCASKTSAKHDYSANVVIAQTVRGNWVVLDAIKMRVDFPDLVRIVKARCLELLKTYRLAPVLVVEDANAGTQLIQVIESQVSLVPHLAAKPVHSKIIRATGVTPMTAGRLVSLLRGDWNDDFIHQMAEFPVGEHDDIPDAFCHGMKAFISQKDFRSLDKNMLRLPSRAVQEAEMYQKEELRQTLIPDRDSTFASLNEIDGYIGPEVMSDATRFALDRIRKRGGF